MKTLPPYPVRRLPSPEALRKEFLCSFHASPAEWAEALAVYGDGTDFAFNFRLLTVSLNPAGFMTLTLGFTASHVETCFSQDGVFVFQVRQGDATTDHEEFVDYALVALEQQIDLSALASDYEEWMDYQREQERDEAETYTGLDYYVNS